MTDDTRHTVSHFQDLISAAQLGGEEWVETTPEIIAHYNRHGLRGARFFIYNGIKVCPIGQREEIEAELHKPITERLHGAKEGKLELKVEGIAPKP